MKTWNDQPDFLINMPVISNFYGVFHKHNAHIEIRSENAERFYLTAGNLFGSQTVRCDNAMAVFALLHSMGKGIQDKTQLPQGCSLCTNSETK